MRRSIRKRLIAGFLGSLLFALVAMGFYLHFRSERILEKTVDTFVLEEAGFIAGIARRGDAAALDRHLALLHEVQFGRMAELDFRVIDREGKVIGGNRDAAWPVDREALAQLPAGRGHFETVRSGEDRSLRVVTYPVDQDPRGALVQVASDLDRQRRDLATSDRNYLFGAAAIFAVATLLSARLVRRAISPIADMIQDAREIHAEDLSRRIHERGTKDELDQLARILNDLLERLQRSLAEIRQFTGEAAHEIRTPLTRIRGEVELLLRGDLPPDVRHALEGVVEELDRLGGMVRDLLALSRADAGTVLTAREPIAIGELVTELADQARVLGAERSIVTEVGEIAPSTVVGDAGLLKRLLWNLLDNAIRYSDPGGRVRISVATQDLVSVVSIEDAGVGIPPEDLPRVFDRFYRGKLARQRWPDGTGLGLSVCRAIARAHGGDLAIASEPGKGTRVDVRLPRTGSPAPAEPVVVP